MICNPSKLMLVFKVRHGALLVTLLIPIEFFFLARWPHFLY